MSFNKSLAYPKLKEWVKNYTDSRYDEKETKNCMISLKQLEEFMNYIHQENIVLGREKKSIIDKIRIYLVRDPVFHADNTCQTKNGEQPQFSFVIVPMTDWKEDAYKDSEGENWAGGNDYVVEGTICAVTPGGESSGLCPNNCGGSIEMGD